ncbi:MAG: hypothetical protein WD512_20090 [Candidatus Paceibacterota bacterium]
MAANTKDKEEGTFKKYCPMCEKKYANYNWYKADKNLFPDGRLHICKHCVNKYVTDESTLVDILRLINKPLLKAEYLKHGQKYLPHILLPQYRDYQFIDSDYFNDSSLIDTSEDDELPFSQEVFDRWIGYSSAEDIKFLEYFYQELISTYESKTPIQRNIYRSMSETQLMANKARDGGRPKEYKDLIAVMSTLMNDAKIKPVQDTGEEDGGLNTWGKWIKKIEEEEPIPEATGEFKDVDKIGTYIDKWFVKHFAKVFGIHKDDDDG